VIPSALLATPLTPMPASSGGAVDSEYCIVTYSLGEHTGADPDRVYPSYLYPDGRGLRVGLAFERLF
jgi:hypothetical protein